MAEASTPLSDFLRAERDAILADWEAAIRKLPVARGLEHRVLLNHLPQILDRIAGMVGDAESGKRVRTPIEDADEHALERLDEGYALEEVVEEYALLRECILARWARMPNRAPGGPVLNRALDQAIAAAVSRYSQARERTLIALDRVSASAMGSTDLDGLLHAVARALLETAEAVDSVAILLREGNELAVRAAAGIEVACFGELPRVKIGEGFSGVVAATGLPLESRDAANDPRVRSPPIHERGVRALYAVPLMHEHRVIGVAKVGSTTASEFSDEGKVLIRTMVQRVSTLIAMQQLRVALARAERERGFLAEASAVLAESLDYETTLRRVAALVVPHLADWCVIDLVEGDRIERTAVVHADPQRTQEAEALRMQYPPTAMWEGGPAWVIRTGQPVLMKRVDLDRLRQVGLRDHHVGLVEALGFRSYLGVPLKARGRVLGALFLVNSNADRTLGDGELKFAEELGRRVAMAVENARHYRDAERAIRARDELWAVASHELRNPLSALLLQIRSVERALDRGYEMARVKERLHGAERQVERLVELTGELLDTTRAREGRLDLDREEIDLTPLVRDIVARHKAEARQAGSAVELQLADSVPGCFDRLRVDQLITNLLSNAIKYGGGKPIRVTLRRSGDEAVIEVQDRGIGIGVDERERLFQPFERSQAVRRMKGLGLGLYISRAIAEAHGGSIELESEPGQGSTFTVRLPLRPPHAGP